MAPGEGGGSAGDGFALGGLEVEGFGEVRLKVLDLGGGGAVEVFQAGGEGCEREEKLNVDGPSGLTSLPAFGGRDGGRGSGGGERGGVGGGAGQVAEEKCQI